MISNRKRNRNNGADKSQDQTTSKKVTSSSVVSQKNGQANKEASQQNVVTPSRTSMPKNQLVSILKSSQEKTYQVNQVKRTSVGFNQQFNRLQKSVTKKDLSSSKKTAEEVSMLKTGEPRAESQPSKKTHVLQKQDSSKYLRGENTHTATSQTSATAGTENPEVKIPKKSIREKSNNSSVTRGVNLKNSAVIYKVSLLQIQTTRSLRHTTDWHGVSRLRNNQIVPVRMSRVLFNISDLHNFTLKAPKIESILIMFH